MHAANTWVHSPCFCALSECCVPRIWYTEHTARYCVLGLIRYLVTAQSCLWTMFC